MLCVGFQEFKMMKTITSIFMAACFCLLPVLTINLATTSAQAEVPLYINCQGRLFNGSELLDGEVELILRIYNSVSGGDFLYEDVNRVKVVEGIYSTYLGDNTTKGDLTKALSTGEAYLEVTANGVTFEPRERLVTVPYALIAGSVMEQAITSDMMGPSSVFAQHVGSGAITGDKLAPGSVSGDKILDGSISPEKLTSPGWSTGGNKSIPGQLSYLGTSDRSPLDIRVDGRQAMRIIPEAVSPSIVAGNENNTVAEGANGVVISGGGDQQLPNKAMADFVTIGGGQGNSAAGAHATVGGGLENVADGKRATVAGGRHNEALNIAATVAGGYSNRADNSYSTIGGGFGNHTEGNVGTISGGLNNFSSGAGSTIGGGRLNQGRGALSTIAGGIGNKAAGSNATIAGGSMNEASGDNSAVLGGASNVASGASSAVLGGIGNIAGAKGSIAAGTQAQAVHPGSVVIADSQNQPFKSTANNQFLIRAQGNVGIDTDLPDQKLTVNGNVKAKTVFADSFSGDGSKLTGIQAAEVAPGAITDQHINLKANISPTKIAGTALTRDTAIGGRVLSGTIDNISITQGAITSDMIANGAVSAEKLGMRVWKVGGNDKVVPGDDYIGTDNNAPFEIKVDGKSALFIMPHPDSPSIIGGADDNRVKEGTGGAVIGGGRGNTVEGQNAVVPGGVKNTARGSASFAAGTTAIAEHDNSFVWSGDPERSVKTTAPGQVLIDAPGGVGIGTDNPSEALTVSGNVAAQKFIGDGSQLTGITANGVAPNSVTDAAIAANAKINPMKIAGNAVTLKTQFGGSFAGTVSNLQLKAGSVNPLALVPESLTNAQVSPNAAIDPAKIQGVAITADMAFNGDVTGTAANLRVKPGTIGADHVKAGSITDALIANNAQISPQKIRGGVITGDMQAGGDMEGTWSAVKLRKGVINQEHLQLEALTDQAISQQANIGPEKIRGRALTLLDIFIGEVEGPANNLKIKDEVIAANHISRGAILDSHIAPNAAISPDKIKGGVLTRDTELGGMLQGPVNNVSVRNGAITSAKIADNAVTGAKVQDGSITTVDIARGSITDDLLAERYVKASAKNPNDPTMRLGTTDFSPFEIAVNNQSAIQILPSGQQGTPSLNMGFEGNRLNRQIEGSTITGGGSTKEPHQVAGDFNTIGGGSGNKTARIFSTVAGGGNNSADGAASTVAGGRNNSALKQSAAVGGGQENRADGAASVVAGGFKNTASGDYSTVPGGIENTAAGLFSLAAGRKAAANHDGSFVWSDSSEAGIASTGPNQFIIQATGNVGIDTPNPQEKLTVNGNIAPAENGVGSLGTPEANWSAVHTAQISYNETFSVTANGAPRMIIDQAGNFAVAGIRVANTGTSPSAILGHEENGVGAQTAGAAVLGGGSRQKPNVSAADYSVIGGGLGNQARGNNTIIVGGEDNIVDGSHVIVGGGLANQGGGEYSTLLGGAKNQSVGNFSAIGGGQNNVATGYGSTIPGGLMNEASGNFTTALGRRAKARHDGAVVIADGSDHDLTSSQPNQFLLRASGGVEIYSSPLNNAGVSLAPGSGSFSSLSDVDMKEDFRQLDGRDVVAKVASMPIYNYKYKTQEGVRHMGPTAQDFSSAFGVGEDERHISVVAADGVALAAIQGLHSIIQDKDKEIGNLTTKVDAMAQQMQVMTQLLEKLTSDK